MGDPTARPAADAAPGQGLEEARLRLARVSMTAGTTLRQALQEVADVAAPVLDVNRVSVWRFLDGRKAIRCDFLHQAANRGTAEGAILHERDFPNYFRCLQIHRVVPIVDIDGDPVTQEFREPYFRPLGITSMLDAPIYEAGQLAGVVCHEQIGPLRNWTAQDCEFAAAVADAIGRLHEEAARLLVQGQLTASQAQIATLQRLGLVGRLAAGTAHDFNNVLQVMLGYADDIAEAAKGQARIEGLAHKLIEAAKRGTHLVGELRALGRERPNRPRVTNLQDMIEKIRPMLARAAGPKVAVDIAPFTPVGQVFIDPDQMERAILNLAVNARDAMPTGGRLTLALSETARPRPGRDEGTYVVLEVSDSGRGMDAETQARMFEPFFTTKGDSGTGLGLAIVDQIVALAGGFIDVESAVGRGTSVRIHLPRIA
jgi:signal transduction histidine kinase